MLDGLTPENIVMLAAVASVRIAQNATAEQLDLLSAFFEVIGDDLALLALCAPSCDDRSASHE